MEPENDDSKKRNLLLKKCVFHVVLHILRIFDVGNFEIGKRFLLQDILFERKRTKQ